MIARSTVNRAGFIGGNDLVTADDRLKIVDPRGSCRKADRIKKRIDFADISVIVPAEPTINTMIQAKRSTTTVRRAVATSESVFLIPHFASIAVSPAKSADNAAMISHISSPYSLSYILVILVHQLSLREIPIFRSLSRLFFSYK